MRVMWGKRRENGMWFGKARRYRVMLGGGDRIIFAHFYRFGLRLMKPEFFSA